MDVNIYLRPKVLMLYTSPPHNLGVLRDSVTA